MAAALVGRPDRSWPASLTLTVGFVATVLKDAARLNRSLVYNVLVLIAVLITLMTAPLEGLIRASTIAGPAAEKEAESTTGST